MKSVMTMGKAEGVAAMEVERFSKLGTQKLQQGHTHKAVEAYRNAYQSSQSLGNHGYMQRACAFNLGAILISTGNFSDGLTYLHEAVPPNGKRDGRSNGDLYFNYGLAYEGLKNFGESIEYFEKALTEYRSEQSNVKMEADTMHRLGKICLVCGQIEEAEAWMAQLIHSYDVQGNTEKRLQAQAERANLLLKLGREVEAEQVADDCWIRAKNMSNKKHIANVLNELGLVYSQLTHYEKALECSESAVPLVQAYNADVSLKIVLYQNLGALYNSTGKFEEALKYHQAAANKHAELKNRRSQGHCFVNMGYAYSQLKDFDKAGECFLHAVQAARDSGDKKSEWQSLEALGAVAYNQKSWRRAQDYYKQALAVLTKSPEEVDNADQDRILAKLTNIIQQQVQGSQTVVLSRSGSAKVTQRLKESASSEGFEERMKSPKSPKDGSIIKVKRGPVVKYMRVRRSGSLRQFKKIARGLQPQFSTGSSGILPHLPSGLTDEDDEELLSAKTISDLEEIEESEEEEEEEDEKSNTTKRSERPFDSFVGHKAGSAVGASYLDEITKEENYNDASDEDSDESDDEELDRSNMRAEMERISATETLGASQRGQNKVIAEVHAEAKADSKETAGGSEADKSSSSSETEDSSEDEKEGSEQQKPPVPTLSPPITSTGTYEKPAQELHYETIDHRPPSGRKENKQKAPGRSGSVTFDSTIYESIRPQTRRGRNTPGADKDSDETEEEDERNEFQRMSKAERDVILYDQFRADEEKRKEVERLNLENAGGQKNSKHCIVM